MWHAVSVSYLKVHVDELVPSLSSGAISPLWGGFPKHNTRPICLSVYLPSSIPVYLSILPYRLRIAWLQCAQFIKTMMWTSSFGVPLHSNPLHALEPRRPFIGRCFQSRNLLLRRDAHLRQPRTARYFASALSPQCTKASRLKATHTNSHNFWGSGIQLRASRLGGLRRLPSSCPPGLPPHEKLSDGLTGSRGSAP